MAKTRLLHGVTAVILAGGLGMRLRTSVADRPKALAEVAGRPFLVYLLDHVAKAGMRRVVLCTGYLGDMVEAVIGKAYMDLELIYSREAAPLGTGGCLRLAAPLFQGDTVLVLNGDSFCQVDFNAYADWHRGHKAKASLVLARVEDTTRFGRVELADDESIMSFAEKKGSVGPGWINAGIYLISTDLIRHMPANRPVSLERDMFPSWIGHGFYGFCSETRFIDIGTPQSYRDSEHFFAKALA